MKEIVFSAIPFLLILLMGINIGCESDLKVKSGYEFSVTHLPVPKRLKKGETAEIRLELVRSGKYTGAKYFVRYFQPDGKGNLMLDGHTLNPNDGYELKKETFRMYYTSDCEDQQVIDLTFYDNVKNEVAVSFTFANDGKVEKAAAFDTPGN